MLKEHSGYFSATPEIINEFPLLHDYVCPHCQHIFHGITKHKNACKRKPLTGSSNSDREHKSDLVLPGRSRANAQNSKPNTPHSVPRLGTRPPTLHTQSNSTYSSPMPTTPHIPTDPLPKIHPRVWEQIPPTLRARVIELFQPALYAYTTTTDIKIKGEIILDAQRFPNELMQKVRGNKGKSLRSLSKHMKNSRTALFASHRSMGPVNTPLAPALQPRSPDIEIWTDGSAASSSSTALGPTGAGIVEVIHATGENEIKYFLGTGTNNRAELSAIILALERHADTPNTLIHIHSDSTYAIGKPTHRAPEP